MKLGLKYEYFIYFILSLVASVFLFLLVNSQSFFAAVGVIIIIPTAVYLRLKTLQKKYPGNNYGKYKSKNLKPKYIKVNNFKFDIR